MHDREAEAITRFIQRVAPVPTDEIAVFCRRAAPKRLAKHESFVRTGEVCEQLLFIHRGMLRYAFLAEGAEHTKDFAVDTSNRFCTALHQPGHGAAIGD